MGRAGTSHTRLASVIGSLAVFASASLGACAKHDDCASLATCEPASAVTPPGTDAGASDSSTTLDANREYPPVPPPAGCDPLADPSVAPLCVDDRYALFVDATSGSDGNPGTKAAPLRTLRVANDRERLAGRPRIYVSTASQDGDLVLLPRVSIAGGFSREDWQHAAGQTTTIVGRTTGTPVLSFPETTEAIVLSDLAINAPPGTNPGDPSIGIFFAAARAEAHRLSIRAGKVAAGVRLDARTNRRIEPGKGAPAEGTTPGKANACTCALHGTTAGGAGGESGRAGSNGTSDPIASIPASRKGEGGSAACTAGQPGADGEGGAGGASPIVVGIIDAQGWHPSNGEDGAPGEPGGGGGGGGGVGGTGGGAGGCGGCGGAGGRGGGAGGSSFGIVSYRSTLALYGTTIVTDDAAAGADGGDGESGELGADGGAGACAGGLGGTGAGGGGGGGGAAGISAAVIRRGGAVTQDSETKLTIGANGTSGKGGSRGEAVTAVAPLGAGRTGVSGAQGALPPAHDPIVVLAD